MRPLPATRRRPLRKCQTNLIPIPNTCPRPLPKPAPAAPSSPLPLRRPNLFPLPQASPLPRTLAPARRPVASLSSVAPSAPLRRPPRLHPCLRPRPQPPAPPPHARRPLRHAPPLDAPGNRPAFSTGLNLFAIHYSLLAISLSKEFAPGAGLPRPDRMRRARGESKLQRPTHPALCVYPQAAEAETDPWPPLPERINWCRSVSRKGDCSWFF